MATPFLQEVGVYVGPSPVTIYRSSTDVVVENTTDEEDLFVHTAESGAIAGDHGIRLYLDLKAHVEQAGADPELDVLLETAFRVYLGESLLWESPATLSFGDDTIAAGGDSYFTFYPEVAGKDSDGAQELFGTFGNPSIALQGESAEDATGPLDIRITVQMNYAHAGNAITLRRVRVEQL